jgi:hypothetical protein
MGPMRAEVTPNPAACVDLEIKLAANDTHAEVAEAPASTDIAPAVLSRESTLACNVPAPLEEEGLH